MWAKQYYFNNRTKMLNYSVFKNAENMTIGALFWSQCPWQMLLQHQPYAGEKKWAKGECVWTEVFPLLLSH